MIPLASIPERARKLQEERRRRRRKEGQQQRAHALGNNSSDWWLPSRSTSSRGGAANASQAHHHLDHKRHRKESEMSVGSLASFAVQRQPSQLALQLAERRSHLAPTPSASTLDVPPALTLAAPAEEASPLLNQIMESETTLTPAGGTESRLRPPSEEHMSLENHRGGFLSRSSNNLRRSVRRAAAKQQRLLKRGASVHGFNRNRGGENGGVEGHYYLF